MYAARIEVETADTADDIISQTRGGGEIACWRGGCGCVGVGMWVCGLPVRVAEMHSGSGSGGCKRARVCVD